MAPDDRRAYIRIAVGEIHSGVEVEGKPEPLFVDREAQHESPSDCGSAEGTVYVSADGDARCVIVHDLKDGGGCETKEQLPVMMPHVPALLAPLLQARPAPIETDKFPHVL